MIKIITKYYLRFPPITRKAINLSLFGIMSYAGVDYYHSKPEDILTECDEVINKKLFV